MMIAAGDGLVRRWRALVLGGLLILGGSVGANAAIAATLQVGGERPGPLEHPAEQTLRELTRRALGEGESVETWREIVRTLNELGEADPTLITPEVEAAAQGALEELARATPGTVREVVVRPAGETTEIIARAMEGVKYRLFHRFSDSDDPRLTIVMTGVKNAIAAEGSGPLERGGVRAVELAEFGQDTLQIAVRLTEISPFTIFERGDEVVLRIENRDGDFMPWSTGTRGSRLAGTEGFDARSTDTGSADTGSSVAQREGLSGSGQGEARILASARSEAEGAGPAELTMAGLSTMEVRQADPDIARAGRGNLITWMMTLLGISALTLSSWALVRRRGLPRPFSASERPRSSVAPVAERSTRGLRRRKATKGADPSAQIWAARTLAASGVSPDEIARQTGLARDAVLLIAPSIPDERPADPAVSGSFFPGQMAPAIGRGRSQPGIRH